MNSNRPSPNKKSILFALFKLMRIRHWIKNGFILAPLIFTGLFVDIESVEKIFIATIFFCIGSSIGYIINDLCDIEKDKLHPLKSKTRPLASGILSIGQAIFLLIFLSATLISGWFVIPKVTIIIFVYVIINIAYSTYLKHQPIIDIFTIATGFVLRVFAGATALSVPLSPWMSVTTFCLALFLGAIKRKQELSYSGDQSRDVLKLYSVELMDKFALIASCGAMLFYSLFVMTLKTNMFITIPLVTFGLFRYWYLAEHLGEGESPTEALLSDKQLLVIVILWSSFCAWFMFQSEI